MWPWLYDTCDITLSHTPSYVVSPKENKKKRNINNDLAIFAKSWQIVSNWLSSPLKPRA